MSDKSWRSDKFVGIDLDAALKALLKIATGATMFFLQEGFDTDKNKKRLCGLIDKIHKLIDEEFKELDDIERTGIAILLAATWGSSVILRIQKFSQDVRDEKL